MILMHERNVYALKCGMDHQATDLDHQATDLGRVYDTAPLYYAIWRTFVGILTRVDGRAHERTVRKLYLPEEMSSGA